MRGFPAKPARVEYLRLGDRHIMRLHAGYRNWGHIDISFSEYTLVMFRHLPIARIREYYLGKLAEQVWHIQRTCGNRKRNVPKGQKRVIPYDPLDRMFYDSNKARTRFSR